MLIFAEINEKEKLQNQESFAKQFEVETSQDDSKGCQCAQGRSSLHVELVGFGLAEK